MQNQPRRLAALVAGLAALLLAALAAILLAACAPIRAIEAVSLLADVAASGRRGEDPAKSAPRPVPVVYVAEERLHNGDLYPRRKNRKHEGVSRSLPSKTGSGWRASLPRPTVLLHPGGH